MSADELNLDYPEHLNPFRHRRNTLARSFRGLKKALVRSFTGNDKDKPTIRPKPVLEVTPPRNVMSMPAEYTEPQVLFPRSRFSERLSKTDAMRPALGTPEKNPFEGREESKFKCHIGEDNEAGISPTPAERKLKRRKKRAPVPPSSVNGSVNESKWSLVSTDSEMSSLCYSESEVDYVLNNNVNEKNEEIFKITREIVKFAEDTNNNNISDPMQNAKGYEGNTCKVNIADAEGDDKNVNDNEHVQSVNVTNRDQGMNAEVTDPGMHEEVTEVFSVMNAKECANKAENNSNECNRTVVTEFEASVNNDSGFVEDARELSQSKCNDLSTTAITETLDDNSIIESTKNEKQPSEEKDQQLVLPLQVTHEASVNNDSGFLEDDRELSQSKCNDLSTTAITETLDSNSIIESTKNEKQPSEEKNEQLELPLQVTHKTEARLSVKGAVDFFESTYTSPLPKIRKNILTKEKLLGSEEI